jgi:hypothetical protein
MIIGIFVVLGYLSKALRKMPNRLASSPREETSQPAENLSSSREARGIRLKKKVRLASSLDSRLRKMTPSEETSQSTMETHQGEQDKNRGMEHLSSKKEKIANLRAWKFCTWYSKNCYCSRVS